MPSAYNYKDIIYCKVFFSNLATVYFNNNSTIYCFIKLFFSFQNEDVCMFYESRFKSHLLAMLRSKWYTESPAGGRNN